MSHLQKSEGPVPLAGGPGRDFDIATRTDTTTADKPKQLGRDTKLANVLQVLLSRGDRGMTCFEAVAVAHDYVLRSTISALSRYYGVEFYRSMEVVPGHRGSNVKCTRYRLSSGGAATARGLLGLPAGAES